MSEQMSEHEPQNQQHDPTKHVDGDVVGGEIQKSSESMEDVGQTTKPDEIEQCKADFIRLQDQLDTFTRQSRELKKEQNTYKAKIVEHMKATNQTMMVFASVKFEIGSKEVLRMSKDAFNALEIDEDTRGDFLQWVPFASCKKIKNA
jgi:hypothetical protein